MEKRPIVVLFGDSLLMDAVAAGLSGRQELDMVQLDASITGEERLRSLCPDLVIFDLDTPHPGFIVRFLKNQPGVPLFGLNAISNKVIAISSQAHTTLTTDDLSQMIRLQISPSHFRSLFCWAREKKIGQVYSTC